MEYLKIPQYVDIRLKLLSEDSHWRGRFQPGTSLQLQELARSRTLE